ncbi:MAG TPA: hypothetical protein VFX59_13995 [Polyangiales bacterium]|nr:hypothetical protein [Polyangiales bacterium]
MGHAATANDASTQNLRPREYSAFLRLRQGGAARATWLVTEAPGGTMISVGADAACDWQIRAAFVPARAFSVLVVGGRAFVRSGPEPGLLVGGKPVDDGWVPLSEHARIDIGLARFEVRTGYADMLGGDEPVLELAPPRAHGPEVGAWTKPSTHDVELANTAVVQRQESRHLTSVARTPAPRRKRTMETQEYVSAKAASSRVQRVGIPRAQQPLVTPAASPRAQALRSSTIELNMDDLDYLGTIPMPKVGDAPRDRYSVSPSLLGADEVTRVTGRSRHWRYIGMAAFFASAYGAWLYLLDRI